MSNGLFQRFQPNNKRGISKACGVCKKQFGFLNRGQHQCKRCIRPVCEDCGKLKRDVYKLGMQKNPHRVCSVCAKQSDFITMYIEINKLKFGQDSLLSKKWLGKVPKQPRQTFIKAVSHKQLQRFNFEVFSKMWDSYNFSFRQFIGLLTFNKNQNDVYKLVRQAYDQLLDKGYDQKIQNIMYVIILLLCFSSPISCAKIVQKLIKLKMIIRDGKSILQTYYKFLKVEQSQLKKINQYMNFKFKNFMSAFSVNILTIECSIHLITQALQWQKIEEFYLFFAIVIQDNLQFLINNVDSKVDCDLQIIRNCQLYKYLQKSKLASNLKIQQFLNKRKQSTQQKQVQDSPIFKTMPNNFELDSYTLTNNIVTSDNEDESRRITQKHPTRIPNINTNDLQLSIMKTHSEEQYCYQCAKKSDKIQLLQKKLKQKQRQVQNLNFKLTFTKKQVSSNNDNNASLKNLQHTNINNKSQSTNQEYKNGENSTSKETQKYKKENTLLKFRIQELQQQNKVLRLSIQTLPQSGSSSSSSPQQKKTDTQSSKVEQQAKTIQMLKKTLDSKNKQLEQTIKKNKLLNFQIEEMQKQYQVKKPESGSGTRDQLMKKIQQLTQQVNSQHDQKLTLSAEIFQLKQMMKQINIPLQDGVQPRSSRLSNIDQKKQCNIF